MQQWIVTDDRERTNVLLLAGPGSGKTRVLVHRIAYLVRMRREHPRGILALAYNRHAAVEIQRRLADLIGDDANGITVLTCHALAMRLVGASLVGRTAMRDSVFKVVLEQAVALLQGKDLQAKEADKQRERLLAGFRWILVDEYQDIGRDIPDEEPPPVWRLRETQQLVEWLRQRESKLIDVPGMTTWLDRQPEGPWWELLRQAIMSP